MIKLSRRKFLCGVAAIAVAAPVALPVRPEDLGERDMLVSRGHYEAMWEDLKNYGNYFEKVEFEAGHFTRKRIDPRDVYLA